MQDAFRVKFVSNDEQLMNNSVELTKAVAGSVLRFCELINCWLLTMVSGCQVKKRTVTPADCTVQER